MSLDICQIKNYLFPGTDLKNISDKLTQKKIINLNWTIKCHMLENELFYAINLL